MFMMYKLHALQKEKINLWVAWLRPHDDDHLDLLYVLPLVTYTEGKSGQIIALRIHSVYVHEVASDQRVRSSWNEKEKIACRPAIHRCSLKTVCAIICHLTPGEIYRYKKLNFQYCLRGGPKNYSKLSRRKLI